MYSIKTISQDEAIEIMSDPELFERIGNDKCNDPNLTISFSASEVIYGCFYGSDLCGVVIFEPESSITVSVHCNFLSGKREHAHSLVNMAAIKLFKSYPSILKVNACVPVCYPDVIGFCLKFGLIIEGIDRKSILKGGKLLDRMRLGATRKEIERLL